MPFQKGHKKVGGRKKGSGYLDEIRKRLDTLGVDLVGDFFEDLKHYEKAEERNDHRLRFMKFVFPEVKGDLNLNVTNTDTSNLADEKLKTLYDEDGDT